MPALIHLSRKGKLNTNNVSDYYFWCSYAPRRVVGLMGEHLTFRMHFLILQRIKLHNVKSHQLNTSLTFN
jgi:hypothetical protein